MNKYHGEISKFRSLLQHIQKDEKILAVIIYGSFLRRSTYRDIDICLISHQDFPKITVDQLLYYKGAFSDILDINFFEQMPLPLQYSVFKEGLLLFCRDDDLLFDLHVKTIKEYELFYPRFKMLLEAKMKYGNSSN